MSATYDPDAAVEYALLFWDQACSDRYICLNPATVTSCTGKHGGDPWIAVLSGTKFDVKPGPPPSEEVTTPLGSTLKLGPGCLNDAAHFVSCCIGTPPAPSALSARGGGYKLRSSPKFPKGPYGITNPNELAKVLGADPDVRRLRPSGGKLPCGVRHGDVILYSRGGRDTHAAIFVSGSSVAAHSVSRSPKGTVIPSAWDYVADHPDLDPPDRWSIYHLPTPPKTFAVTVAPFPSKAALDCGSKPAGPLQSRVDLSVKLTVAAATTLRAKSAGTLAASVIDLTGDPANPPRAGFRETETFYIGSMAKLFAMFAAFELRNRVRRIAVSSGLDPASPGLARTVTGAIEDAWKTPVAKGFAKLDTSFPRQFPKLGVIFEFGCFGPGEFAEFNSGVRAGKVPPDVVDRMGEFGRPPTGTAFHEWLDGTIRYSNNWAADKVITALGYPYINGVLREAGFQSAANPLVGQLLLAGSYRHEFLHDDWADGKDLGQLGPIGTGHYQKNTNFVGNPCEVARLLASVATRQAFGADHAGQQDCDLMMQMMKHGPGINGNGSPIRDALEQVDPGIGPISGKIGIGLAPRSGASPPGLHDCAIVERTTGHGKKLRYVMAVLGGYDSEEDPFNMMVQGLDGCITF